MLGLLYGAAPGAAVLYQGVVLNRFIGLYTSVAVIMSCSMAGLLVGAMLDRATEAVVARLRRDGSNHGAAPDTGRPGG